MSPNTKRGFRLPIIDLFFYGFCFHIRSRFFDPGCGARRTCPPLERVVAINEAAARAGLDLGMTKSQALQFRSIAIRLRSRVQEEAAHAALLDLGWSVSPRVEDTAADSIVADLTGLASLFGSEETISHLLVRRASDLG